MTSQPESAAAGQPLPPPAARPPRFPKQAVVVVHGMGEQRPMDTVKSFVETVWQMDLEATRNGMPNPAEVWSKPDERSGSLEVRRIATRESSPSPGVFDHGVRSDFFELYWADLTAGTSWEEFRGWLWTLLLRDPRKDVPKDVLLAWFALWAVTIAFVCLGLLAVIPSGSEIFGWRIPDFGSWRWLVLGLIAAGGAWVHARVQETFGRVARYTRSTPNNIAARKAVRERGLALLEALHNDKDYCRIVLVSHSLGAIVAYELLSLFWARHGASRRVREGAPAFAALCRLERLAQSLAANPKDAAALAQWPQAQRALRVELAKRPLPAASGIEAGLSRWIISDFITLGSPLTHAEFLMASSERDLAARQRAREMPAAPPAREGLDPENLAAAQAAGAMPPADPDGVTRLFSFPWRDPEKTWEMHHAALFAVVRWTNMFDPARWIFQGDLISGPARELFGPAIEEVDLGQLRGPAKRFTHTKYWDKQADARQLAALRRAVNILDKPEA